MKRADLDLYTDYLLSTFDAATATGLSAMLEGEVSHDRITRFLSGQDFTSKDLWQQGKSISPHGRFAWNPAPLRTRMDARSQ